MGQRVRGRDNEHIHRSECGMTGVKVLWRKISKEGVEERLKDVAMLLYRVIGRVSQIQDLKELEGRAFWAEGTANTSLRPGCVWQGLEGGRCRWSSLSGSKSKLGQADAWGQRTYLACTLSETESQ